MGNKKLNIKELVKAMTLEEKAALCSGLDFWHSKGVERLGLPSVMMTDGPHGLRKQEGKADHLGINESIPSTCFPTASATASSFDRELLHEIGVALGEECLQEEVSVILGPGVNIKRSPLCGRNFEYFSEDPYISGELGTALVNGIQSQGVGASLKHYAANNQEFCRMIGDSVVDERALHEIYLSAFEKVVCESQPWTVMCSYNKLNGIYASENRWLLHDVLREAWEFDGVVVSDWGAVSDRVAGLKAGMDLEMPGCDGRTDLEILAAIKNGTLREETLDAAAERIVKLLFKAQDNKKTGFVYDKEKHHALARRAAADSSVLLKNDDGILPLAKEKSIAVIGAFAKTPRYQGSGSSKIYPNKMESVCDALDSKGIDYEYAPGYSLQGDEDQGVRLLEEAGKVAFNHDVVLLFAGLPDAYEQEGFDRDTLKMSENHLKLIETVAKANDNVVVILQLGSPVELPWKDNVKAILLSYLGGQAGGGGCVDILFGDRPPSGKLAESWAVCIKDVPSCNYFPGGVNSVRYQESIFVGYRFYDAAQREVAYPFGYGLSYTDFAYSELSIGERKISCRIKNIGSKPGAEVAQLYLGLKNSKIFRAKKELKGFQKVFLKPGESKLVQFPLDGRSYAYYNTAIHGWAVEQGLYTVEVGASSRDIRLNGEISVRGDGYEEKLLWQKDTLNTYFNLPQGELLVPDKEFEQLYAGTLPPLERLPEKTFTLNSTLYDIMNTPVGKMLIEQMGTQAAEITGEEMKRDETDVSSLYLPLRAMLMMGGGALTPEKAASFLEALNNNNIS